MTPCRSADRLRCGSCWCWCWCWSACYCWRPTRLAREGRAGPGGGQERPVGLGVGREPPVGPGGEFGSEVTSAAEFVAKGTPEAESQVRSEGTAGRWVYLGVTYSCMLVVVMSQGFYVRYQIRNDALYNERTKHTYASFWRITQ